jgi:hypothetical protein
MSTKRKDNVAFVKDLMTYSNYGALAQLFIIDAIDKFSKMVAEAEPIDHPLIDGRAWKGVAQEIQQKLASRN